MMNFNELRKYIIANIDHLGGLNFTATDRNSKKTYTAVYLVEKPETHDLTSGNGIVIKFNEVGGGQVVRHFVVEIRILSKNLSNTITIREGLSDMLDFYRTPCRISRYKKFVLSNDGGAYFDDKNKLYINKLFFDVKLI